MHSKSAFVLGVALMGMPFGLSAAHAEDAAPEAGGTRKAVESAIALEETRMTDLTAMAEKWRTTVNELEAVAKTRETSATEFYARAKEFRSASNRLKGPSRTTVNEFATAMNTFARTDQEMAKASRQAAEVLKKQAANADANVEQHKKHVEMLKQSLADWK